MLAVAVIALAGCAGGGTATHAPGPALSAGKAGTAPAAGGSGDSGTYDEGISGVVRPSSVAGGTLTYALAGTPDSLDYQDTSEPFVWDFARLYSMQLLTYRSCPGACGRELVPDLATGLGEVSDHGLVWTYHLHPGVKFQNGQPVTAADVKYGIERSYARAELPYGPDSFQSLLGDRGYTGPYADPSASLTSVTTPNATTIQFHLLAPFADFNYLAASVQATPVLPSWDSGRHRSASFQLDPVSTGPYEFQSYQPGKRLVLSRNPEWDGAADPQARQLPQRIVVEMGLSQQQVDARLLSGTADLDLRGAGLQRPAVQQVLTSQELRAHADAVFTGSVHFAYLNLRVIPDLHCREAIEAVVSRSAVVAAYGGPAFGVIASQVLPPVIGGYDPALSLPAPGSAAAVARRQLRLCGRPRGFATRLAYPAGEQDAQAAMAVQRSLASVGINARLVAVPAASYYSAYAGSPSYVASRGIGVVLGIWRAAWPDGYAFLDELADGSAIAAYGNVNIAQIDDPEINALFRQSALRAAGAPTWRKIDERILALAAIVPLVDSRVVLYRSPALTNVYADEAYGMDNYAVLGVR
jgi:peptide/nickel transport system substrate-binding protein